MRLSDLHTIINHFGIAFVILGILTEFYCFLREQEAANSLGWTLLKIGTVCVLLSTLTGFISESKVFMDSTALPVNNYHKMIGLIALAILAGSVMLRSLSKEKFFTPKGAGLRGAYLTLLTIGLISICGVTYFGMELVYQHGVSVTPYEHLLESIQNTPASIAPPSTQPVSPASFDSAQH